MSEARVKKLSKKKTIILAVLVALIAFRLYLPTLAKNYINGQLNRDPLYRGQVERVRIHLWRGAYSLVNLDIRRVNGQNEFPFIAAENIDIGISWKELMHRAIRAKLDVKNLVINIVREQEPEGEKKIAIGRKSTEGKKEEAHGWKVIFKNLVPIDVGRLIISGQSIHYRDLTTHPRVDVYFDQLDVQAENLTNSEKISKSLFGTVEVHAQAMGSGALHLVLYTDPLVSPPEFKATIELKGLDLTKLNGLFTAYGRFDVKHGNFGLYSEMATADNNIKGYAKPIITDLKVADFKADAKKGGVLHAAWELIVGLVGQILKNYSHDEQAAKIDFEGRLNDPKTDGWGIARSILSNMFVKAIAPKIDHTVKLKDVQKSSRK